MLISSDRLQAFVSRIFERVGCTGAEAGGIARHLVVSNLTGHDSHGVGQVPKYIQDLGKGIVWPGRSARLIHDTGSMLQFDGQEGFGWTVGSQALEAAIERAGKAGLVLMTLGNSHHLGRVGAFGEMAAQAGLVSLHFVNVTDHDGLVAPHLGSDARFGTNPLCIGFPATAETPSFVLDVATSRIALGKVRVAMDKGEQVPEGHLLDADGRPTRDPAVMFGERRGALLAFAEHKGYGLAYACELLAGVLSRHGTVHPGNPRRGGFMNCLLTIVIDPGKLGDLGWIEREIDATARYFLASQPIDPASPVLMPGDPERIAAAERTRKGIPLAAAAWSSLLEAARSVGVAEGEMPEPASTTSR